MNGSDDMQSVAYMTGSSFMQEVGVQATAQASWSPLWAAPEVVRLEKGNVKADIWSLGLIIWVRTSHSGLSSCRAEALPVL